MTGTVANAAMVDMEDVYPEGCSSADHQEGGSGDVGIEINANMVETYEGWVGKERDKLVAAIDNRSKSPTHAGQKRPEYRQRSRTPNWVERRGRSRGRSREPITMQGARRDESPIRTPTPPQPQQEGGTGLSWRADRAEQLEVDHS